MTLQEMIDAARLDLGEVMGHPAYRDPLPWERHLRDALNEMCRRTYCFYTTVTADVTANAPAVVQGLCSYPLFEIEEARLKISDGTTRQLRLTDPTEMYPGWRTDLSSGFPDRLVLGGANNLRLYPSPFYTLAAALSLTGYGTLNGKDGAGAYLLKLTDQLPLPQDQATETAMLGAQVRRCKSGSWFREYRDLLTVKEAEYERSLDTLRMEARAQSRAGARVGV